LTKQIDVLKVRGHIFNLFQSLRYGICKNTQQYTTLMEAKYVCQEDTTNSADLVFVDYLHVGY
jgi:hypothetical protein